MIKHTFTWPLPEANENSRCLYGPKRHQMTNIFNIICHHHFGILLPPYLSIVAISLHQNGHEPTWDGWWRIDFQFRNGGWCHGPIRQTVWQCRLHSLSLVFFFGRKNHHWFCLMVDSGFKPFQKYTRLNWIISPRVKNKKSLKEQPKWLLSCSKCWSYQFVIGLWTSRWALKPGGHFRQCKPWLQ